MNKSFNSFIKKRYFFKIKKLIAYIIASLIIFESITCCFYTKVVKADFSSRYEESIQIYQNVKDALNNNQNVNSDNLRALLHMFSGTVGLIFSGSYLTNSMIYDFFRNKSYVNNNNDEQSIINDVSRHLVQNVTFNDNRIIFNSNSKTVIEDLKKGLENYSGFKYVYSSRLIDNISNFNDGAFYNSFRQFMLNNEASLYTCTNGGDGHIYVGVLPSVNDISFVLSGVDGSYCFTSLYDNFNWEASQDSILKYVWDSDTYSFNLVDNQYFNATTLCLDMGLGTDNPLGRTYNYGYTLNTTGVYKMHHH